MNQREKPFIATLTDVTRSFIQGTAGKEFYRLERNAPQRVSAGVAAALRETLYEVTITGDEPATDKIAEIKQNEGANDGNEGHGNESGAEAGSETGTEEETGSEEAAADDQGEAGQPEV